MNLDAWINRRKQAAQRRRRIIMNNDGDDAYGYGLPPHADPTPEAFWSQRCTGLENTQVDSIFYNTCVAFNLHSHDSCVAELCVIEDNVLESIWPRRCLVKHLIEQGRDNLQLIIDFCRAHDKEVFWSLRMNDIHDNWHPSLGPRFKKEHPELLMFQPGDIGRQRASADWPEPHMLATAVDYDRAEIRDRQFAIIEDVCRRYDVDGIELDFLRKPYLFRPTIEGRPCDQECRDLFTSFIRRVRDMTEDVGRKRDRPLLVACRVPSRVECCRTIGIDIARWMADDLIDVLISSLECDPYTGPLGEMVELGHRHGAPVYAGVSDSQFALPGVPDRLPGWAAAATNAYAAGADGIHTFNNFDPTLSMWSVIGDPAALAKMDKVYAVDNLANSVRTYEHVYPLAGRLPVDVPPGRPLAVNLPVGEDLVAANPRHVTLRFLVDRLTYSDRVEFRFNDRLIEPEVAWATDGVSPVAVSEFCLTASLNARDVCQGANRFTAELKHRCPSAPGAPVLTRLWLIVRHGVG